MTDETNVYRKFTFNEVATMSKRLSLHAIQYYCEVGTHTKPADMIAISDRGFPVHVCLECATRLIGITTKRTVNGVNNMRRQATTRKRRASNGKAKKASAGL